MSNFGIENALICIGKNEIIFYNKNKRESSKTQVRLTPHLLYITYLMPFSYYYATNVLNNYAQTNLMR